MLDNAEFQKEMCFILKQIQGSSAFSLDQARPYDGQPHTDQGLRGKTFVSGLTMRDVADCMVRGFLDIGKVTESPNGPTSG